MFVIDFSNRGRPDWAFGNFTSIASDVWITLTTPLGSRWSDPTFGNEFETLKKFTGDLAARAESLARKALQWLLRAGKAKSIDSITLEVSESNPNRINFRQVQLTQADGTPVSIENFVAII